MLTGEQRRFLSLHATGAVEMWRWVLGGAYLRACAYAGSQTATISRTALDVLIDMGLMEPGAGFDVRVTEKGLQKC